MLLLTVVTALGECVLASCCHGARTLLKELHTESASAVDRLAAPLLAAHKDAVRSLLLKLLAPAANNGQAFDGQPAPLLTAAVRLYGSFGKWLAKEQPQVLEGCVHCVLKALLIEESGEHAAVAFTDRYAEHGTVASTNR